MPVKDIAAQLPVALLVPLRANLFFGFGSPAVGPAVCYQNVSHELLIPISLSHAQSCQDGEVSLGWSPSSAMSKRTQEWANNNLSLVYSAVWMEASLRGILRASALEVLTQNVLGANQFVLPQLSQGRECSFTHSVRSGTAPKGDFFYFYYKLAVSKVL